MPIYKVKFTVEYTALVVADSQDLAAEIQDIDIPEGGEHRCNYVADSFEILEVTDHNGNEVPSELYEEDDDDE